MTDASVSEDILEVRHRGGTVKMYSVPWIIQNCTVLSASLGKYVELNERNLGAGLRAGAVGNPGFGIPCTVKLKGKYEISWTLCLKTYMANIIIVLASKFTAFFPHLLRMPSTNFLRQDQWYGNQFWRLSHYVSPQPP